MSAVFSSVKNCLSWQSCASVALAVGSTLLVSSYAPGIAATVVQGAAAIAIATTSALYLNALGKEGASRRDALRATAIMVADSYNRAEEKFHSISSQGESSNAPNTTAKKISENIQWAVTQSSDTFMGAVKLVGADKNEVLIGSAVGSGVALLTGWPVVAMTGAGLTALVMEGRKERPEPLPQPVSNNPLEGKEEEEQSPSGNSQSSATVLGKYGQSSGSDPTAA